MAFRHNSMQRFLFYIAIIFLTAVSVLTAQEDSLPEIFSTPQAVIENHLKYLQEDNYLPIQSLKSLNISGLSFEEAKEKAIKLKQIFDGAGIYIHTEDAPGQSDHTDSLTNRKRYVVAKEFPNIFVQKYGDRWLYSKSTVDRLDAIHRSVYPYGTDQLLNLLPRLGSTKYVGLHLWQILGVLILVTAAFILNKLFTFVIQKVILRLIVKYGHVNLANKVILPVARPFSLMFVAIMGSLFIPVLQLPTEVGTFLILLAKALVPFFATVFAYKLVDIAGLFFQAIAERTENTLDDQLVPLAKKILKVFVILVGFIAVLKSFHFDIIPLLTGLSLGGLAFALAAQDTLKNFFGSLMIFIDRPFQIGDWVTSGDVDGTVIEVGFRSTRIRTFRDSVMYVPNSIISNSTVDNHGLRKYRRFYTKLSITYDTPARLIEVFVEGIEEIVKRHPHTRKDAYNIFLNDYASSSLDIMLYIFFQVPDWNAELRCRQEIMLEVNKLAEHLGVRFAFPTQTLMVEQFPDKKSLTPKYETTQEEMKEELKAFFNQTKNL